jgi:sterol desaturase/sphingolipid hydroxylase (fatty acid hydroxylase superfamily)
MPADAPAFIGPELRSSAAIGWLVLLLVWETVRPFRELYRSTGERARHAARNLTLALLNAAITGLVFAALWRWAANLGARLEFGLLHWLPLAPAAHVIASLLLLDLWTYAWHRTCHRVPMLWRFHRVHHSDATMDVTTAGRFHLGEIVASSLLRLPLLFLLGIEFWHLVLYETVLQLNVQWQHANITLAPAVERWLSRVLITPGLHQVHHSREPIETDSNYSSVLAVWDWIFASRRQREDLRAVRQGLDGFDMPDRQSVSGLLREPLRGG